MTLIGLMDKGSLTDVTVVNEIEDNLINKMNYLINRIT